MFKKTFFVFVGLISIISSFFIINSILGTKEAVAGDSVVLISPNGGERVEIGKTYRIRFNTTISNDRYYMSLLKNGSNYMQVLGSYSYASGENYFDWNVPTGTVISPGDNYKIKIYNLNGTVEDTSDANFTIFSNLPAVTVVSPNGGEKIVKGQNYKIEWNVNWMPHPFDAEGAENKVDILYRRTTGSDQTNSGIIYGEYNHEAINNYYMWSVPNTLPDGTYRITIRARGIYSNLLDEGDADFNIITTNDTPPGIRITSPGGGENWEIGKTHNITWESINFSSNVDISICKESLGSGCVAYIAKNISNTGSYIWDTKNPLITVSSYSLSVLSKGNDYKIYVASTDKKVSDGSEYFSFVNAFSCTDSDNGKDYYAQGNTFGTRDATPYSITDWCDGSTRLVENFCTGNVFGNEYYTCPNGCENGACKPDKPDLTIKENPSFYSSWGGFNNVIVASVCNDGKDFVVPQYFNVEFKVSDINKQATWVGYQGETFYKNTCKSVFTTASSLNITTSGTYNFITTVDSSGRVDESNELNNGKINAVTITIGDSGKCFDSDSGRNYYTKGYTTYAGYTDASGQLIKEYDTCVGNILQEKYCPSSGLGTIDYTCPNGCENGACKKDDYNSLDIYAPEVNGMSVSLNGVTAPQGCGSNDLTWCKQINPSADGNGPWEFNWKDGTKSCSWFPGKHTYKNNGTYDIEVRVKNTCGYISARTSQTISIKEVVSGECLPDGTLIKIPTDPKIYVIRNCKKEWIQTAEEFRQEGYKWEDVKEVNSSVVQSYSDYLQSTANLLRAIGQQKVYRVVDGKILWVPTVSAFNAQGLKWEDIQNVDSSIINQYSRLKLVRIKGDPKVYYLTESGLKRWVPTIEIFNSYNNKWEDVIELEKKDVNGYSDNVFIKLENDSRVYKIENGKKRWIKTEAALKRLGVDWSIVAPVNQAEFNFYPEGAVIE